MLNLDSGPASLDKTHHRHPVRRLPMPHDALAKSIDDAFDARDNIGPSTTGAVREAVEAALELLDRGVARVAERDTSGKWHVNQWLKKAVLLSFRLNDNSIM